MRVLFDHVAFDTVRHGGISRYLAELIADLRRLKLAAPITPFFLTENRHLIDRKFRTILSVPPRIDWRHKAYYAKRINELTTRIALQLKVADLCHLTYYDLSLLDLARCPTITTVYDMIPELLSQYFDNPAAVHPNKKILAERASAVFCISHTTKSDLTRLFGIEPEKIFVTHLGIDPDWAGRATPRPGLPDRFILFVGNRYAYKNFAQLVESMGRLSAQFPDLHLVCVGGGGFTPDERAAFESGGLTGRVHQFEATDGELATCYSKAAAFVFPSFYEGFGLPVLESFLCACPAILSRRGALPEVADEAAAYFDPDFPQSLDDAIERVVTDAARRDAMIRQGRLRVADFTSEKTAIVTALAYRTVLDREYSCSSRQKRDGPPHL